MGDTSQGTERRVFVGGMPFSYEVSMPITHAICSVKPFSERQNGFRFQTRCQILRASSQAS